ncbi:MAG: nicotinamide mononucleotide transporter family protein, partial [Schleiferiaceae bacterium]|nr:nicotinamide mononucleotide transporter family protein [Schleiferiaceae bacterium]
NFGSIVSPSQCLAITFEIQSYLVERGRRLQEITESKWMDAFGVLLVLVISFALGFHKTVRQDLPIGIFSTFGAAGSMMVTRLVTKRNNIGNLIGLLTAVNSAFVDYFLGNDAAFLTYPISFLGAGASYLFWKKRKDRVPRKIDAIYFINIAIAFALGVALNYIGFTDFLRAPLGDNTTKFTVTAIITGITYSGILNTPRMYADSWASWQVYNVLKLYQNVLFGNIAYVAKYAFYLLNASLAWVVWHRIRKGQDYSEKAN